MGLLNIMASENASGDVDIKPQNTADTPARKSLYPKSVMCGSFVYISIQAMCTIALDFNEMFRMFCGVSQLGNWTGASYTLCQTLK